MSQTSSRLLELLSLLQGRRDWPGDELAGYVARTRADGDGWVSERTRRMDAWVPSDATLKREAEAAKESYRYRLRELQDRSRDLHLYSWVPVAGFQANIGILLDPLSISFVLLVTGVGSLILIYAVGYMGHDTDRRRFFGYKKH